APSHIHTRSLHDALPISSTTQVAASDPRPPGLENWRPHRDSKWFEAKLTFQTAARPPRPKRSRFRQLRLCSQAHCIRIRTLQFRSEEHTSELQSRENLVC